MIAAPKTRKSLSAWGERIVGVGSGIIIGSFMSYYLTEIKNTVSADTYVTIMGITVIITGYAIMAVAAYRNAKGGKGNSHEI